jgi:hypothetical protein
MIAYFNKFEISLTKEEALSVTGPGDQIVNLNLLTSKSKIRKQLDKIDPQCIKEELKEYGITPYSKDYDEMQIVWLAAASIVHEMNEKKTKSNIYTEQEKYDMKVETEVFATASHLESFINDIASEYKAVRESTTRIYNIIVKSKEYYDSQSEEWKQTPYAKFYKKHIRETEVAYNAICEGRETLIH